MPSADEEEADGALIHRFLDGDEQAFEVLMDKYYVRIGRLALRILGDSMAAEDIAQEVFLRAFRFAPTYRFPQKFSTWLFTISIGFTSSELLPRLPTKSERAMSVVL